MRDYLREQLQREITRKEFIQILGVLLLSVFGVHNFVNIIAGNFPGAKGKRGSNHATASHGFGSSKFGV
jgi:hypothetical protein